MSKTLDLGCGPNPKNPLNADEVFGIDIIDFGNPNIKVADLAIDPIPFDDNTFDYVSGFDFLEHIPRVLYFGRERKQPFIDIMSEVWRVLKPGGEAFFATPAHPHQEMFQDPQHVNYITPNTLQYFCYPSEATFGWTALELCQSYGFKGAFHAIQQGWREDVPYHLIWHIKAIK
jgi:SAM-dependent methyltransferase